MTKFAPKNKTPKKVVSKAEEKKKIVFEEDDDEDDDDDDVEDDDDEEDDSEEVEMEEGDDDDDEDEEEEDDEEEDDSSAVKSKKQVLQKALAKKNANKNAQKTPQKKQGKNDKPVEATPGKQKQTPKGQKRKAEDDPEPNKKAKPVTSQNDSDVARLEERDRKSLYVNFGVPVGQDLERIKSLSSDILSVRSPKFKARFAFLEFESEKIAEKNFKLLQNKTFENQKLKVDFVGAKSKNNPKKVKAGVPIDKLKLFIGRLPEGTTEEDLKEAFPKAKDISIPHANKKKPARFAFIVFHNEDDAKMAYEESSSKVINGKEVIVLHAKLETLRQQKNAMKKRKGKQPNKKEKQQPAFQKKSNKSSDGEEEDDDDEDDDDDDDEEDGDSDE